MSGSESPNALSSLTSLIAPPNRTSLFTCAAMLQCTSFFQFSLANYSEETIGQGWRGEVEGVTRWRSNDARAHRRVAGAWVSACNNGGTGGKEGEGDYINAFGDGERDGNGARVADLPPGLEQ